MTLLEALGGHAPRAVVVCDRCPTVGIAPPGRAPAGWVWTGDTRVCGECWKRAVRRER